MSPLARTIRVSCAAPHSPGAGVPIASATGMSAHQLPRAAVLACALVGGVVLLDSTATAQRLPVAVIPEHYRLSFTPDLEREEFRGETTIRVRVTAPTTRIVLNAADLRILTATVDAGGTSFPTAVSTDQATHTLTLTVDQPIAGPAAIRIVYTAPLNRDLRGFYISEANNRKYAVTQLEATDARRMFPSFDEPRFKATFDIAATVAAHDTAISNGAVESISPGPSAGTRTFDFATTKPMSTYLVALAVGDFVCRRGTAGDTPLGVCARPGHEPLMAFAMEAARATLDYMNAYFAIDYPFGKLDLVAIPDFAAGAMENTGAVFFREALLLVGPDAGLTARKRVVTVIAHELAHMWFGNLVTMQWWDDLWLNEGFATWMETKAVAAWQPGWDLELDDVLATQSVMAEDARHATRAIRTAAETPAEIEALFDPIAYEKAAAVLGMVESFVGERPFQSAINTYLDQHQYANATAEDFWTTATRATSKPVERIMKTFVDRPGVPMVGLETACNADHLLVALTQAPFAAPASSAFDPWVIPVCLETRGDARADACYLLDNTMMTVKLPGCSRWVVGNDGAEGYYRTRHGRDALQRLIRANAELAADERLMLIADQWALLRAGVADLQSFLMVARAFAADAREPAVVLALGARLQFIREYLTDAQTRASFERWVREQFAPTLRAATRLTAETDTQRARRAALLGVVGAVGRDPGVIADAARTVRAHVTGDAPERLPAELLDAYVGLAALSGGRDLYDLYRARVDAASSPEDRYRFFYALAAFREEPLIRRTIAYALSPEVRAQDRASLLVRLLANPVARPIAWQAIQDAWQDLQSGLGAFGGTLRIIQGLDAFCDQQHAADIKAFFTQHPVPGSQRALAQTLEDIERCASVAQQQRPGVLGALPSRQ